MRIIYNKFIPFKGFGAMNILGLLFSRLPEKKISITVKRHEQTHTYQQYEILGISAVLSLVLCNIFVSWWYLLGCLVIPFVVYVLGFLIEACIPPYHNVKECFEGKCFCDKVRAIPTWFSKVWLDAYRDNCFEREAYLNENNPDYLATRKAFAWVGYILKRDERRGK